MSMFPCPECKKNISDTASSCPKCGHPVSSEEIDRAKEVRLASQKQAKKVGIGCGTIIAVLWIIGTIMGPGEPDEIGAFVMSQQFVENALKSPSTADFCSYTEARVVDLGEGRFRVTAWVDSENSFGATVRTKYVCHLKGEDSDTWTLEALELP